MDFTVLSSVLDRLEGISGRLEMTDVVSDFISNVDEHVLPAVISFIRGSPFPVWSNLELGISDKLLIKAISSSSGLSEKAINDLIRELGDVGLVAERVLVSKPQKTLFSETLSVERVYETLHRIVLLTGKGSQDKKLAYVSELYSNASPIDSKYITRLILGQLRIGVGDGVIRDSISKAFNVDSSLVERAHNLRPDWGEVALTAKGEGNQGLEKYGIVVGEPMKVMLAQKSEGMAQALSEVGNAQLEVKYDGARVQIHKRKDEIRLFTRRLENVTTQFPDVVSEASKNIKAEEAVLEGEIVAVSPLDRAPLPFQNLSRRIRRKHGIGDMVKLIPVEVNLFDVVYVDGVEMLSLSFSKRRKKLSEIVSESHRFRLAENIVTSDLAEAEEFYQKSLLQGHEGVMVKVLDAPYKPGSRVGYMYKVKPVMESLDLVVTGATWGEGRRARWLGSYLLSAYDSESGEYLEIGRMATGLTDEQLAELTSLFTPLITSQEGQEVSIKPEIVFEVAYEEIQSSPTYSSGYAMRFPRLVRVRQDKGVDEADTIARIEQIIGGVG
jgi:DNA ligase 1